MSCSVIHTSNGDNMPNHIKSDANHQNGLYGRKVVEAVDEDMEVAKSYPEWQDKGPVIDGRRLTIMAKKQVYHINEEVRIIHVLEAPLAGYEVYIMGPKEVFNEYVDGHLQGNEVPLDQEDPFTPTEYDGRVLDSPATDFNFDITVYSFVQPGIHEISWQPGKWKSNILAIEVVK
jgi:hypothetical protein